MSYGVKNQEDFYRPVLYLRRAMFAFATNNDHPIRAVSLIRMARLTRGTMKILLGLCFAIAFVGATQGQPPPKDVEGWDKIQWGMTAGAARAAYDIEDQLRINEYCGVITTGCWDTLALKRVKIGDISMAVSAKATHNSGRITRVSLWLSFGLPDDAPFAGPHDFDTLKTLLIQKYGIPVNEEIKREYGDPVRTALWVFPSTSILLKISQKESLPSLGSIDLIYTATDKKALDAL